MNEPLLRGRWLDVKELKRIRVQRLEIAEKRSNVRERRDSKQKNEQN